MNGTLFIVATPIGNLEDITLRAIRTLKEVDLIAAEDTRHARILLQRHDIKTPLDSFHSYSGEGKLRALIEKLQHGKNLALISDAGTPGISDPGYRFIRTAINSGIRVVPIPGPAAFVAGLVVSGLPMDKFVYLGYLPLKKGRQTLFKKLRDEERTIVFYESPYRITRTLRELAEALGDRPCAVARELTKIYEEVIRGTLREVADRIGAQSPRGEYVVVIGPPSIAQQY